VSVVEDDSGPELSVCPEGVLTVVSSVAASVLCTSIAAGVLTAASSVAASVPCSSTLEDVPTSISISALGSSTAGGFLIVLSVDLDFRFLLQGLVKPSRLSNYCFWVEDLRRFDLRIYINTKSSDFKSLFIPALSRIILIVVGLAIK
jgi:hypothetical protein